MKHSGKLAPVKHVPGYYLEGNTGAICYKPIDGWWHYCNWPKGIICLVDLKEYEKDHPNWKEEAEWKLCMEPVEGE